LAYVTRQRGIDLKQFVHEYYSVNRFRAAYGREIGPMTDKTQWAQVELPLSVSAPLAKLHVGRHRKLRMKGWDEGGHKKKGKGKEKKMVKRPMWVKVRMILLQPMPRERKWLEDL